MQRRHYRRRRYALLEQSPLKRIAKNLGILAVGAFAIWFAGNWAFAQLGVGNPVQRTAVQILLEERGLVEVSIEGAEPTRAKEGLKLYAGDSITTGAHANATLVFFDGTTIRLDERTTFELQESTLGAKASEIRVELPEGSLWVSSPELKSFSGSIARVIEGPTMTLDIPAGTEALISTDTLAVFSANGLGISVSLAERQKVVVGEGQQFALPDDAILSGDLYSYRTPLDAAVTRSAFVLESREEIAALEGEIRAPIASVLPVEEEDILVVSSPSNGATIYASTVNVRGRVGASVDAVRVNGYLASLDEDTRQFSEELALQDEDNIAIVVEALDADSAVLAQVRREITRDREPPEMATITLPATDGQTYRTQESEIIIRGTAPKDAVGIMVNDYRLQLFAPGDDTWSYLASTQLSNLKSGENIYNVKAINAGGYNSEPVTLIILLEEGTVGVIASEEEETETEEEEEVVLEPEESGRGLFPGTTTVSEPGPGTEYTLTHTGAISIKGSTSPQTYTVTVNDYKLSLYEPGTTNWKYIASLEFGTLRNGRNRYRIVSRNSAGKILDEIVYTIIYQPEF